MFDKFRKGHKRHASLPSTWRELAHQIVDYGKWDDSFKNAFHQPRSVIITGRPGLGKSTYLLWAISSALSGKAAKKHNGAVETWFSQAIFLDRTQPGLWPELLSADFSPDNTLVVIDGLFEIEDEDSRMKEKLRAVKNLAAKFRLAVTVRDDEYKAHSRAFDDFEAPDLKWHKVLFWQILQKRLEAWGGPRFRDDQLIGLEDDLRNQSENAPIYLELLTSELADPDEGDGLRKLRPGQLRDYVKNLPKGMINLVWQIVTKICREKPGEEDPILFLLKSLQRLNVSLSNHFQSETVRVLCPDTSDRARAIAQLARLRHYLGKGDKRDPRDLGDPEFNKLWSSHWREALASAGTGTGSAISSNYSEVLERYVLLDYEQVRDSLCEKLAQEMSTGIRSIPRAVVCSDIIKLKASYANKVTDLWVKSRETYPDPALRNRLDDLIFDSWLAGAFAAHNPKQRSEYFHAAFHLSANFENALRLVEEKKPLNRCITLQRNSLLPFLEGKEFDDEFADAISLCERLIELDKADAASRRSLAHLYQSVGDFESADLQFRKAANDYNSPDLERVFTLIEWGKCLQFWGEDERAEKYLTKQSYLDAALANFEEASSILNGLQKGEKDVTAVLGDISEAKRRLRTAHAIALKGTEAAEKLLRDNLEDNPNDPPTLNALAHLLVANRNIKEARRVLEPLTNEHLAVPDPRSLRILGLTYIQSYMSPEQKDFARAEESLIRARDAASQRASNPYDRSALAARASSGLANMYLDWVDQKPPDDPSELLSKAKDAVEGILRLPKNANWASHFAAVQPTLMRLKELGGPQIQSEESVERADDLDGWYEVAANAWSGCQGNAVIRAYRGWLERLEQLSEQDWLRTCPGEVCEMLRWVGITYAQRGEANDLVFAGRYYASLCYALRGKFPLSVDKYPTSGPVSAAFTQERKLNAARLGNVVSRGLQLQLWKNKVAAGKGMERALRAAIVAELEGKTEEAKQQYLYLADQVINAAWDAIPTNLRLLADGLLFQNEREKSAEIWTRVVDRVGFPEQFFAIVLASAIGTGRKERAEYIEGEVFINKGEVYRAYTEIKGRLEQARTALLIIDPHVSGEIIETLSTLPASVEIRILATYFHGDFRVAYKKLQKERGKIEVRQSDHFHDRFVVVDRAAMYQLGGSIKDAGAKATVIDKKEDATSQRILKEAERIWTNSPIL